MGLDSQNVVFESIRQVCLQYEQKPSAK
jgi:hypothetical protein